MSAATLVEALGSFNNVPTMLLEGLAGYTGLPQPPATGYEYTDCTSTSWSGQSLQAGSTPAVVVGDVFIVQSTTTPSGYAVILHGDGTLDILAGGDNSRQSLLYDIYRVSGNLIDGPGTVWINEIAPAWGQAIFLPVLVNVPLSVNLAGSTYATSAQGDTLTFALTTGSLPPGVTISSAGLLSGTPTILNSYFFTISATDITSTATASPPSQITVLTDIVSIGDNHDAGIKQTQVVRESHYNKRKAAKIKAEKNRKAGKRTPEQILADEAAIEAYMEAENEHIEKLIQVGLTLIQSLGVH
jgi:hypothetical protein